MLLQFKVRYGRTSVDLAKEMSAKSLSAEEKSKLVEASKNYFMVLKMQYLAILKSLQLKSAKRRWNTKSYRSYRCAGQETLMSLKYTSFFQIDSNKF